MDRALGNAVLNDEACVMDTIQSLRRRAEAAGNLQSTSERSVLHDKETIVIEPAQSQVVYVPVYDAAVVYGAYASSYDYYYERYYGSYSVSVSYGKSYTISREHWGWGRADWSNRRLAMSGGNNRFWNQAGRAQAAAGGAWRHEPMHRRGIDYPNGALRDKFAGPERGPQSLPLPKEGAPNGLGQGLRDRGMPGSPSGAPPSLGLKGPVGGFPGGPPGPGMGPSGAFSGGPTSLGPMAPPGALGGFPGGGLPGGPPPAPPPPPPFPH